MTITGDVLALIIISPSATGLSNYETWNRFESFLRPLWNINTFLENEFSETREIRVSFSFLFSAEFSTFLSFNDILCCLMSVCYADFATLQSVARREGEKNSTK